VRAADLSKKYVNSSEPVDFGLRALAATQQPFPLTAWNVIIRNEAGHARLLIKGAKHSNLQYLDLDNMDFSCRHPVQMQKLDLDAEGDVRSRFADYDPVLQEYLVRQTKHLFTETQIQMILHYPDDQTKCLDAQKQRPAATVRTTDAAAFI
jgi:hypothetical protein